MKDCLKRICLVSFAILEQRFSRVDGYNGQEGLERKKFGQIKKERR